MAKVMIITGATSGIGKGAAFEMARRKWRLVLSGRNSEAMKHVVEECKRLGAEEVTYVLGDLTDSTTAKKIVGHAIKTFGQIDSLINNAGMLVGGNLESAKDDLSDYDAQMDGNVKSVVRLTKVALPFLIKSKGTIVNVSSVCGTNPMPGAFYYCMSKSALDQFTKCLAMEVAPKGVRVNSVNPGVIRTEFQQRAGFTEDTYQQKKAMAKVMIITGATSGIGKGAAFEMARRKWRLVLSGRNSEAMKEVVEECKKLGAEDVTFVLGDLTDPPTAKNIVDHAIETFGQIDSLINNAGMAVLTSFPNASETLEDFDTQFDNNVKSVLRLTKHALDHLIKTKGTIVNISSIAGLNAYPTCVYYCMSKSALDQFTKCLAMELASQGVRVNSVNPGAIVTNFMKRIGITEEQEKEMFENCKKTHPLGRVGQIDETAKAIAFLATDDSSFITGELLKVDGGATVYKP
ncbi:unnamed protein product [Bursaphelenchus okinawaensis]|uniref:Uncharacterized protein n=1 Tax=Bursaphelenchus okinawaensis TaxID=465554 RepID=A0A811KZJ8_9BILA|nr:unnamed protein product [Bursaphelenchus okinawaensis]CAG9114893.1 unnamed protein product [Bursaphelenchus okinawaensis]